MGLRKLFGRKKKVISEQRHPWTSTLRHPPKEQPSSNREYQTQELLKYCLPSPPISNRPLAEPIAGIPLVPYTSPHRPETQIIQDQSRQRFISARDAYGDHLPPLPTQHRRVHLIMHASPVSISRVVPCSVYGTRICHSTQQNASYGSGGNANGTEPILQSHQLPGPDLANTFVLFGRIFIAVFCLVLGTFITILLSIVWLLAKFWAYLEPRGSDIPLQGVGEADEEIDRRFSLQNAWVPVQDAYDRVVAWISDQRAIKDFQQLQNPRDESVSEQNCDQAERVEPMPIGFACAAARQAWVIRARCLCCGTEGRQ